MKSTSRSRKYPGLLCGEPTSIFCVKFPTGVARSRSRANVRQWSDSLWARAKISFARVYPSCASFLTRARVTMITEARCGGWSVGLFFFLPSKSSSSATMGFYFLFFILSFLFWQRRDVRAVEAAAAAKIDVFLERYTFAFYSWQCWRWKIYRFGI